MTGWQGTPGPWVSDGKCTVKAAGRTIAMTWPQLQLTEKESIAAMAANAAGIAAFPQMLAALIRASRAVDHALNCGARFGARCVCSKLPLVEAIDGALQAAGVTLDCPGHVASDDDPKVCRHCGTHVDEYRDEGEDRP